MCTNKRICLKYECTSTRFRRQLREDWHRCDHNYNLLHTKCRMLKPSRELKNCVLNKYDVPWDVRSHQWVWIGGRRVICLWSIFCSPSPPRPPWRFQVKQHLSGHLCAVWSPQMVDEKIHLSVGYCWCGRTRRRSQWPLDDSPIEASSDTNLSFSSDQCDPHWEKIMSFWFFVLIVSAAQWGGNERGATGADEIVAPLLQSPLGLPPTTLWCKGVTWVVFLRIGDGRAGADIVHEEEERNGGET